MTTSERKLTDLQLDTRVRERLLASGAITAADIEAYTAGLADVEAQAESIPFEQPALSSGFSAPRVEAAVVSTASVVSADDGVE
ncbi:hypothetical protein [Chondromyces crocatus]|uniref:Amidase n=1 Tax=Chondromyces crocatus TaxID=52 RepID=A0A0K1ERT0_CHOCO|nr:hypothetical protein [Chondromyces crocatus]AKT43367.1 uncharacterized protein CMC5_075990 [Chondromyces crocatus]